jgi:hypothetical protein
MFQSFSAGTQTEKMMGRIIEGDFNNLAGFLSIGLR